MVPAGGAPHHDEPGNTVLSRRAMIEDGDSWLELLPIHDANATIWEVVVACPECGTRQTFRGTGQGIGDAAEVWQKGHQCTAHVGETDALVPKNGTHLKVPGFN
jgi:hypothetical protein